MTRVMPKRRPVLDRIMQGLFGDRSDRYIPESQPVQQTRPSGAASVDAYQKALDTPVYKRSSRKAQRRFRRESEADLGQFKDVI